MCMGSLDSCFWFGSLCLVLQVLLGSPLSACGEPPHRNGPPGTGRDGPDKNSPSCQQDEEQEDIFVDQHQCAVFVVDIQFQDE